MTTTKRYECTVKIETNPVREAVSRDDFINNLIKEYNATCGELFEINAYDLTEIQET